MGGVFSSINFQLYHYAGNNPVKQTDPNGECATLVGAIVGAATGFAVSVISDAVSGRQVDWGKAGASAAGGALAGAMMGSVIDTAGASGVAIGTMIAAGAMSNMAGNTLTRTLMGEKTTPVDLVTDAAAGAAGVMAGEIIDAGAQAISKAVRNAKPATVKVKIDSSKYPQSAQHIKDAQAAGQPKTLTVERTGASSRRAESLAGTSKVAGKQLDEYPPAMFKEGGAGASVRPINPADNMGAGASMGNQLRKYPNGTKVQFVIE